MPSTPDFNKIFSINSPSTPFQWTDADYLTGWNSIAQTPPSRQQFDALQMISDLKSKYLMDVKAPIHSPIFTGDPEAPTPPKSDNDTSIATTAFVQAWVADLIRRIEAIKDDWIAGAVLSNPGYVKFGNGFIIQWAKGTTDASGFVTFNLPISFTHVCVGVGTDNASGPINGFHIVAIDTESSLSQITAGGMDRNGSFTYSMTTIGAIFVGY